MQAELTQLPTRIRQPVSTSSKLSAATFVGIAVIIGSMQFKIGLDSMLMSISVIFAVVAAVVLAGMRWGAGLGAALVVLMTLTLFVPAYEIIWSEITDPQMPVHLHSLVLLPLMVVATLAGITATVQNYRRPAAERRVPRWLTVTGVSLAGLAVGAVALSAVIKTDSGASLSPEMLASLPAITTNNMSFDKTEIHVKAGELVAYRLENADSVPHMFDIDELGVHTLLPMGQSGVALFRPTTPGIYRFYCAPHYNKSTGEGMQGTLVVEP